ncbi:hypothetical protein JCGZ_01944 [Jatropha curcas]|uniref:Uncharacterized protein n=1 Tax=Jatropha curcas TaxID=180498 RepID=A0A067L566_JATCU|nr:hypothetical protein JCGZ_01944 [Jatropha curcas]
MPTLYIDLLRLMRRSPISCPLDKLVTLQAGNSPKSLLRRLPAMAASLFSTGSSIQQRRGTRRSTGNRSRLLSMRTVVGNGEMSLEIEEPGLMKETAPIRVAGALFV